MRRAALIPVVALTAAVISSCTATTTGNPSPGVAQSSASSTGAPTSAASNPVASLKACNLLTDSAAQQAVPGAGVAEDDGQAGGSSSTCSWTKAASDAERAVTFSVTIRPNQTIDQVNVGSGLSSTGTVNSHQARQVKGVTGEGTCSVSIGVGGTGRVDIFASAGLDSDQACTIAGKIADSVEPKLPA